VRKSITGALSACWRVMCSASRTVEKRSWHRMFLSSFYALGSRTAELPNHANGANQPELHSERFELIRVHSGNSAVQQYVALPSGSFNLVAEYGT
jgi:hypothetical protein